MRGVASLAIVLVSLSPGCAARMTRAYNSASEVPRERCGAVSVRIDGDRFTQLGDMSFELVRPNWDEEVCVIDSRFDPGPGAQRSAELVPASSGSPTMGALQSPQLFERFHPDDDDDWLPDISAFPDATLANGFLVPPGSYRVSVRYAPGPCDGRFFTSVCIAVSEAFELREPSRFLREYAAGGAGL